MIPLSNTPWRLEPFQKVVDRKGEIIVQLTASHLTEEECNTILRAIVCLPHILELIFQAERQINHFIGKHWKVPKRIVPDVVVLRHLIAYIAPIEHTAEVATSRWLHAVQNNDGTPEAEQALRKLTLALGDTLNGDMSHYSQPVQDAFAHAMSLLNLSKHMKP